MTPEDISQLTLEDLEAIASRFTAAVTAIREAQMVLGMPPVGSPQWEAPPRPRTGPTSTLPHLEEQRLEREAYLASIRKSPERAAKLEQFAHDEEEADA